MKKLKFYNEYPKTCKSKDFWGQIKRTVNGVPVSDEQIDLIVNAVIQCLSLNQQDTLLDLGCGNGALTTLLLKHCKAGLGIDFSGYLISVACKYFANKPRETYLIRDMVQFCENPITPEIFSKLLCYGAFQDIEPKRAEKLLKLLHENFPNLRCIFIGNCPDKNLLSEFFGSRSFIPSIENDADAPLGVWRTQAEFSMLAERTGWYANFHKMPSHYYASHYRYDVILTKQNEAKL